MFGLCFIFGMSIVLLQILFSEARVLGLGPRFMSIYIQKLAVSCFGLLCSLIKTSLPPFYLLESPLLFVYAVSSFVFFIPLNVHP